MYHAIVARMVRRGFERLSARDYSVALAGAAANVHHVFAGEHPLGGERHSREAFRRWFERLFRLFPAVYVHAYENSQAVADACRHMAAHGVAEAAAAPITD